MSDIPLFIRIDLATPDQAEDLADEVRAALLKPELKGFMIGYEPGGISPRQFGAIIHSGASCASALKGFKLGPRAARIVADTKSGHGRLRLIKIEASLVDILRRMPNESIYGLDRLAFHREVRSGCLEPYSTSD
jgi:hypothetical protein